MITAEAKDILDGLAKKIEEDYWRALDCARDPYQAASTSWIAFMSTWTLVKSEDVKTLTEGIETVDAESVREMIVTAIPAATYRRLPCGINGIDVRPRPRYYPDTTNPEELEVAYNHLYE